MDISGGLEILLEVAGQDATEAYIDTEHSDEADEILSDLEIGTLDPKSMLESNSTPQGANHPIGKEPTAQVATGTLKPDKVQEFQLLKKTIISHNVAMSV